jgi:cell division septation protein DedD
MDVFDRDPVSVASKEVHGPSFGMGTLSLVAILALGAGTILGGVIMPLLRSNPPDLSQSEKLEAEQASSRALLFSMYPQTIYASLKEGGEVVSTGMSVEQYLTEVEVRASQSGLLATKIVERKGDRVEISYAFSKGDDQVNRGFPRSKTIDAHPKSLVLIFSSGPLPATIALQKSRIDGRDRGAGATFIDLVSLGATPPALGEGQFLTTRGVFEIKLTGDGVGAFLDDVLIYPAPKPTPGPALSFPGTSPKPSPPTSGLPKRLALQAFQPAIGTLKDRLIMVASESADQKCGAKAIILDATRGTVTELPEPLQVAAVGIGNAKDAILLSGFCVVEPTPSPEASPTNAVAPLPEAPKTEIRLSARYDLKTGAITWQRETVTIAPPLPVSALENVAQTGPSTPWRETGNSRLASPLAAGGALLSVACRPGGGVTIALSGIGAPADGQAAGIRFASGGGSAVAQMRWRTSAGGYELDGAGRPNEARAILDRLRVGGPMTVSGVGASKVILTPGRAQIDRLVGNCGAPTPVAASAPAAKAAPKPAAPKTPSAAKPKPNPPKAAPKAPPPTPKPAPKPKPQPRPEPKPAPKAVVPNKD